MTIAAVYRKDDRAIFISDFRVTKTTSDNQKVPKDISFKFTQLDDRIGLFLAGDVNEWKDAISKIEIIKDKITFNNIDDEEENPLREELISFALQECKRRLSSIGFIINDNKKENKVFKIEVFPGKGCIITPIINGVTVIGSGGNLPNIENRMKIVLKKAVSLFKDNLHGLGHCMRNEIKSTLSEIGSEAFQTYGISTIMSISILEKGSFYISGEDIEGKNINKDKSRSLNYSFKKGEGDSIILKDIIKEKIQKLEDINSLKAGASGGIFDPEMLEER